MARIADGSGLPQTSWLSRGRLDEVEPFVRDRFRLDFVDALALIRASGTFYWPDATATAGVRPRHALPCGMLSGRVERCEPDGAGCRALARH
jgi:hypothetical protein